MFLPIGRDAPVQLPSVDLNSSASRGRRLRRTYTVKMILGQGAFGVVKLVQRKETNEFFAMKVIEKWSILESRRIDPLAEEYVRNEMKIGVLIRDLRCPFLAKLCAAFQTEEKLYYMMEYYSGGDLFSAIEQRYPSGLPTSCAITYVSEMLSAIGALHSVYVLHRDVRLENILLDAQGHVRLCDYGLALLLTSDTNEPFVKRRTTVVYVGANEIFQAPETYREAGYGAGLDFWQLGIMTYVMCTGEFPPIRGTNQRSSAIYQKLEAKCSSSPALISFTQQLLEEQEEARLGYTDGAPEISRHELFCNVDWNRILAHVDSSELIDVSGSENSLDAHLQQARDSVPTNFQQDVLSFHNFTFQADSMRTSVNFSSASDDSERQRLLAGRALMRFSSKNFGENDSPVGDRVSSESHKKGTLLSVDDAKMASCRLRTTRLDGMSPISEAGDIQGDTNMVSTRGPTDMDFDSADDTSDHAGSSGSEFDEKHMFRSKHHHIDIHMASD